MPINHIRYTKKLDRCCWQMLWNFLDCVLHVCMFMSYMYLFATISNLQVIIIHIKIDTVQYDINIEA